MLYHFYTSTFEYICHFGSYRIFLGHIIPSESYHIFCISISVQLRSVLWCAFWVKSLALFWNCCISSISDYIMPTLCLHIPHYTYHTTHATLHMLHYTYHTTHATLHIPHLPVFTIVHCDKIIDVDSSYALSPSTTNWNLY